VAFAGAPLVDIADRARRAGSIANPDAGQVLDR
jgi:hypothetical protein